MEPSTQTRRMTGVLCGLAAALIWGGFPVMTRLGIAHSSLDMFDITFLRFAISGLLLAPLLFRSGFGEIGVLPVALMVFGIGAPYMLIVSYGLTQAPVGVFAVTTPGSMIVISVLLSAIWLRNSFPLRERIGLLTIATGICLAGYYEFTRTADHGSALGLFLIGGFLWAVYTVSTRAFSVGALHATAIVSVVSALIYIPVYAFTKGDAIFDAPLIEVSFQALYQGVLVSIAALYLYSKSVSLLGPTVGASFAALVPIFAVIEASLLLGEIPSALSLIALVFVSAGMAISIWTPRKDVQP